MIKQLRLFQSGSFDPYYNLAVEQHLMETVSEDCCILYLWQNSNTVVIGRNQNAWKECRTTLLEEEGGHLARRLSGGGAVFHDLGNLNFTFLLPASLYNVDRQLSVILEACRSLGIPADKSGRNDVLADGKKFSGNAFYKHHGKSYHHGTLMVNVDKEKLGRYLSPSRAKLQAKGVDSVRSRVMNLCEFVPDLTIDTMKQHMITAFETVYGLKAAEILPEDLPQAKIAALREKYAGWQWLYGAKTPFTFQCEERFPWGSIQLLLQAEEGVIQSVKAYSDAMDWRISQNVEEALTGVRFSLPAMKDALSVRLGSTDPVCVDLCRMLEQQDF